MTKERPNYPRRAVIERTIEAARCAGIRVEGFEVSPTGTIRILTQGKQEAGTAFDRWKAGKG